MPYRGADELNDLRREVEELRAELAELRSEPLHPFVRQIGNPCQMCRQGFMKRVKREGEDSVVEMWGPGMKFEPAAPRRWWKKATPARMRRDCQACGAVYYTKLGGDEE